MAYFPKSQIKSNLYTNGGEFTTNPNQSLSPSLYVGYYFQTSTGKYYTGKTPQDGPTTQLYPIQQQAYDEAGAFNYQNPTLIQYDYFLDQNYAKLQSINLDYTKQIPPYTPTLPTDKDKSLGAFSRYFCKKNNELIYLEISQQTYSALLAKSSTIAWDLYTAITTIWYIKGNKEKTYKANKGLISLIEQRQKWYGFSQYLKEDFLKYYLGE